MDEKTWSSMTTVIQETHTDLATTHGATLPPMLYPFTAGRLVGFVQLRPVYQGKDAASGIAEMSTLAAAAAADEILLAWETQDIALACQLPPLRPGTGLNILWASPTQHLLRHLPYQEQVMPGRAPECDHRVQPQWFTPEPDELHAELEPAIEAVVKFSWEPLETSSPDALDGAARYLRSQGYSVDRTAQ